MAIMPPMGAMKTTHSAKELIQDAKNLSLNPILFQVMTKVSVPPITMTMLRMIPIFLRSLGTGLSVLDEGQVV